MNKISTLLLVLTLLYFGKTTVKAQAPAQCQDVMLQAFYWDSYADSKWTNLNSKVGEISSSFSLVWLPPSGDDNNSGMGYTPVEYFNQNNKFGTSAELKTLISNLKSNGTKSIADIVINHRNGNTSWTDFPPETYKGITYTWGSESICRTDECVAAGYAATGANDTGDDFGGARDIDHTNLNVRTTLKAYLDFMKNEMGYAGWRYDMTKGFSASYVNEYNNSIGNYFSVGECWDGYDRINSWINACNYNSTSFDFPVKYALNSAMWNGGMDLTKLIWLADGTTPQPAGLIHHSSTKRYAVTFLDNHDTYRGADKFNGNVLAAYAFLMGSPGVPCVFLPHWNANKAAIAAMIYARRAVQLHSESAITVNQSAGNIYVATATGKNGTLIVKIGSGSYTPPAGYTLATSGTDYAIWTKTITDVAPSLTVSPSGGTYYAAQSVTLSASGGASVYYTTDNTPATTASTLYTVPISVTSSKTLRAIAYNPTTQLYSAEATNNYTISSYLSPIKVRFKVPAGWTSCKVYSWDAGSTLTSAWPGTAMTLDADGYYSYTVSGLTVLPIGIVFNNGAGVQTVDLSTSADKCWDAGVLSGTKYPATEVACVYTGVEDPAKNGLGIYPNPSHGKLTLEANQKGQVTVYNLQGKQLLQKNLQNTTENLDLSTFGKGVYMLRFDGKSGRSFRKIVIE